MNYFSDYKYSLTKVTAIALDESIVGNPYIWIAFAQNSNGVCLLKKVSSSNLSQVYYTISVPATSINAMLVVNSKIFLAVTPLLSGTYQNAFLWAYSVTNPLTQWTYINKPIGSGDLEITESAIALTTDGTSYVYALTPGIESGTVATIVQATIANIYNATIPLEVSAVLVRDASCITIDASNNLWISTNTSPSSLIRVWNTGVWNIEETLLS